MGNITFEGFVQERRGKMLRVSEEYRKRDQAGNWSNDGYGDFTVWLKDENDQPEVQAGAVVLVSGTLKASKVEKDGRTFTNLNVGFAKVGVTRLTNKYQGAPQGAVQGGYAPQTGDWSSAPISSPQTGAQGWTASDGPDSEVPF